MTSSNYWNTHFPPHVELQITSHNIRHLCVRWNTLRTPVNNAVGFFLWPYFWFSFKYTIEYRAAMLELASELSRHQGTCPLGAHRPDGSRDENTWKNTAKQHVRCERPSSGGHGGWEGERAEPRRVHRGPLPHSICSTTRNVLRTSQRLHRQSSECLLPCQLRCAHGLGYPV